ncbi:MAG: hypothetical protein KI793_22835 [Rivularia sp. (in: Bacteria)]|nr:hypothetical protein [Rivularia sp. MS3]
MEDADKEFQRKLNQKFKHHKFKPLSELLLNLSGKNKYVEPGTLVFFPVIHGEIRFKTSDEPQELKHGLFAIVVNDQGIKLGITPIYIQWFLTQDFVVSFLSKVSQGTVMPRIPRKTLYSLQIPIPKQSFAENVQDEIKLTTPFRVYVQNYYQQYSLNYKYNNFDTCAILAGAICEAILYQLLIDNGVNKKILDDDHGIGLGKLITYVRLLRLDEQLKFDTQPFKEINKLRNRAVHYGNFSRNSDNHDNLQLEQLIPFDNVIKQFGI